MRFPFRRMRFSHQRAWGMAAVIAAALIAAYASLWAVPSAEQPQEFGVQFSKAHAEWLGLDWRAAYAAILDDLGVRRLRLGAYWNAIESTRGVYRFEDLDEMMDAAHRRGALVLLAVGRRLPRWPECHVPAWAATLPERQQQEIVLTYIRTVVERYREHPALAQWQVENEPLLPFFGNCPSPDRGFLEREIALVRALDARHPLLVTDSGELSTWMRTAALGDLLGTTMYRVVWNRIIGYWSYDRILPPASYRLKAWLVGKSPERMIIAELQAEPWIPGGRVQETPLDEQRRSMDAVRLQRNIAFARATGFRAVYLWGSEYWYWLKTVRNDASLWDGVRTLFVHGNTAP